MTVSPFTSDLLGPLLSDPATAEAFSDRSAVREMLAFESALAIVEERLGVIPAGSAPRISAASESLQLDWRSLGEGSARDGHPVAALVRQLRQAAGGAGEHVHFGATAQDAMDTALALCLRAALAEFDTRLRELVLALARLARSHRNVVMAGRTRTQQAVPVSFGLKVATWLAPLGRHRRRLAELRPRVLVAQLGGAAGTLSVLGSRGPAVLEGLARELGLEPPTAPWHSQRDGVAEVAGWFSLVTGSLAKLGQDVALLAQTEVGEVSDGSAGGSSAMPHKSNPVRSEVLVAIGRANAGHLASMHQAAIHEHERSGAAWTLEWLALPQMAVLTGSALRLSRVIVEALSADPARMRRNIEDSGRVVLSEAAVVALSRHCSVAKARLLVEDASCRARETGQDLFELLEEDVQAAVDWGALRDPASALGAADELIDRMVAAAAGEGTSL